MPLNNGSFKYLTMCKAELKTSKNHNNNATLIFNIKKGFKIFFYLFIYFSFKTKCVATC